MQDRDLFRAALGLVEPWMIAKVELDVAKETVEVHVVARAGSRLPCPKCGQECGVHDRRERRWRHLDTCEYQTAIVAQVPRIQCEKHGVRQVRVPWGEPGSRHTKAIEAFAVGW